MTLFEYFLVYVGRCEYPYSLQMSSPRKVVELFYDVVSPYSWLAFEVHYVFAPWYSSLKSMLLNVFMFVLIVCFKVLCRYRNIWNIDLKFKPAFLGGVMQGAGNKEITCPQSQNIQKS